MLNPFIRSLLVRYGIFAVLIGGIVVALAWKRHEVADVDIWLYGPAGSTNVFERGDVVEAIVN